LDESIALVEFSKHSEKVWSKSFNYTHIELGLKIWNLHRLILHADANIEDEDVSTGIPTPVAAPFVVFLNVVVAPLAGIASIVMDDLEAFDVDFGFDFDLISLARLYDSALRRAGLRGGPAPDAVDPESPPKSPAKREEFFYQVADAVHREDDAAAPAVEDHFSGSEDELAIARRGSGGDARLVEGYLNFLACGGCTDADGLAGEARPVDAPGGVRV
jgi:hypothetical protein